MCFSNPIYFLSLLSCLYLSHQPGSDIATDKVLTLHSQTLFLVQKKICCYFIFLFINMNHFPFFTTAAGTCLLPLLPFYISIFYNIFSSRGVFYSCTTKNTKAKVFKSSFLKKYELLSLDTVITECD